MSFPSVPPLPSVFLYYEEVLDFVHFLSPLKDIFFESVPGTAPAETPRLRCREAVAAASFCARAPP